MGSLAAIGAVPIAVLGLIWLSAHFGFSGEKRLPNADELAALLDGLPGGFVPFESLSCPGDGCVLAVDEQERLAIVAPHGAYHLARLLSRRSSVAERETAFTIRDGGLEARFDAGEAVGVWRSRLCGTLGES